MFRALVFAVLTLVLSREIGDGTVPVQSADVAAEVPAVQALLADDVSAPVADPATGDAENLPHDGPVTVNAEPALEQAPAADEAPDAGGITLASNVIPADDPLMSFDAWSSSAYPAFSGVGAGEEQDVGDGGPQTNNGSGPGANFLPQGAAKRVQDQSEDTDSDAGKDTATDTDTSTDPGTPTDTHDGTAPADDIIQTEFPPTDAGDPPVSVPEPGTAPLLSAGLAALFLARHRRQNGDRRG